MEDEDKFSISFERVRERDQRIWTRELDLWKRNSAGTQAGDWKAFSWYVTVVFFNHFASKVICVMSQGQSTDSKDLSNQNQQVS